MDNLDCIKSEITQLYKTKPSIHISVRSTRPKVILEKAPAVIVGVYRNIFQIEENGSGHTVRHTFQYGEVLIGQVVIEELDFIPTVSILNKK